MASGSDRVAVSPFPSRRAIRRQARRLFVKRGRPRGTPLQFWRESEQQLLDMAARRVLRALHWPAAAGMRLRRRPRDRI
jgi:hypothetical protein